MGEQNWDLVMHFDAKGKLFVKRPYQHGMYHSRIYVKTPGKSEELLKLLRNWHVEELGGFFQGGMFKMNNYGEVLRLKKLVGKVDVFPSFIDFIINDSENKIRCLECGEDLYLTVEADEDNRWLIGECRTVGCKHEGTFTEFFKTKYMDIGKLGGMDGFEYEHEIDESQLYKCLCDEYNNYWRGAQKCTKK